MNQLIRYVREYEILGRGLAIMLAVVCRRIIWQIFMWLRGSLSIYGHPSLLWTACILYFAFLLWIFLLLMNNGKRYPGMVKDALLGGCLLTVAAVLHDADVFTVLSRKGFGAAAWVTLLGASALVISNSASMSRIGKRADDTLAEGGSLPAE
ncbi:hypothetical protein [Granulicella arctica]|uniref:Uncharacterized protein n=1 Tax=Granulicella arctica TaxID=940613 RepID=A0A7Y9TGG5_9BACT|nr:hypothetical protein [Granulicella arctica]NYF79886.1 hypothetical protein [Granulicella arctica]